MSGQSNSGQNASEVSTKEERALRRFIDVSGPFALVVAFLAAYVYYHHFHSSAVSNDPAAWGQFGDYIGGVLNPAFSFFAFMALLVSLSVQGKELKQSRIELEHSAKALADQNLTLQQQRIDQSFFTWLDSLRPRLNYHETDMGNALNEILGGQLVINAINKAIKYPLHSIQLQRMMEQPRRRVAYECAFEVTKDVLEKAETSFIPVLESFALLLDWVARQGQNGLGSEEVERYVKIAISSLNQTEIQLLFLAHQVNRVALDHVQRDFMDLFKSVGFIHYDVMWLFCDFGKKPNLSVPYRTGAPFPEVPQSNNS